MIDQADHDSLTNKQAEFAKTALMALLKDRIFTIAEFHSGMSSGRIDVWHNQRLEEIEITHSQIMPDLSRIWLKTVDQSFQVAKLVISAERLQINFSHRCGHGTGAWIYHCIAPSSGNIALNLWQKLESECVSLFSREGEIKG